jgi:ABC-type bacteriocin/lantibiotic exporter with double-glycine peptidase domain
MIALPDIRQRESWDCGPAAVRSALTALGYRPPDLMATVLGTSPSDGTDPRAVESYLRREGLAVISGEMTLADLTHFTKTGRPVLCLVTKAGCGHWVTVAGRSRGRVHFQDPDTGPSRLSDAAFLAEWIDHDRLGVTYRQFGLAVAAPT